MHWKGVNSYSVDSALSWILIQCADEYNRFSGYVFILVEKKFQAVEFSRHYQELFSVLRIIRDFERKKLQMQAFL